MPQRVVERHDAARPQQPQRLLQVAGVLPLVGVAEDQVVGAVGQPGQHVERLAGDQPDPVGRDAGLGEGLAGRPVVLGLHVDRGEHPVRAHPAQQPHRADAGAGADLHDRLGADGGGQDREGGPAARPIGWQPSSTPLPRAVVRTSSSATNSSA